MEKATKNFICENYNNGPATTKCGDGLEFFFCRDCGDGLEFFFGDNHNEPTEPMNTDKPQETIKPLDDETALTPIRDAFYAMGFPIDYCDTLADNVMLYLKDAGMIITNQSDEHR